MDPQRPPRLPDRRSTAELCRLVGAAIIDVCNLPRPGLQVLVTHVEAHGRPPERLEVWATLHFLLTPDADAPPLCCEEPDCHLGLFADRRDAIDEHVRHAMGLKQRVSIEFREGIETHVHDGVTFARH